MERAASGLFLNWICDVTGASWMPEKAQYLVCPSAPRYASQDHPVYSSSRFCRQIGVELQLLLRRRFLKDRLAGLRDAKMARLENFDGPQNE
jgi:hypothetical protein